MAMSDPDEQPGDYAYKTVAHFMVKEARKAGEAKGYNLDGCYVDERTGLG